MTVRTVWIDGTGLLFRAFHALPTSLCTPEGQPTNAIFGFAQMFRRILRGRTPTLGAVVFDAPGPKARHALDPGYKAHRPSMPDGLRAQLDGVAALVQAHGFATLSVPGVEADDVLASLCRQSLGAGHEVTVVSGDKDLLQLLTDDRVRVFDPTAEISFSPERARRKFGVLPGQIPDLLGLAGDPVDGIPGVPGIGMKTAARLLAAHGDLEAVLAAAGDDRTGRALRRHRERALHCRELARLDASVPTPAVTDHPVQRPTPSALNAVYARFGFYSLLTAERARQPLQYFVCDTEAMATAALAQECAGGPVAVQVLQELALAGAVTGVALSPRPGFALYLPFRGPGRTITPARIRAWLEDPQRPKLVHDAKQARTALTTLGIDLAGVIGDTALASYLLDPTRGLPHRLEQVARRRLKRALQPLRGLLGSGRAQRRFDELTVDRAGAYACHLADAVGQCWGELEPELAEEGLLELLDDELVLSEVLAAMELRGIAMEPSVLQVLEAGFIAQRAEVARQVHALAGRTFNIGSPKQLAGVLYDDLSLPVHRRTKTGRSTAAAVLDRLDHPIIAPVKRWRTLDLLVHTYTEVLVESVAEDGRIHCTFQQTASATGRVLTTQPDLQRTPVRSEEFRGIRRAFVAPPGFVLLAADWSQFELRVLAHLSRDPVLLESYRTGADLHARTAAALFDRTEAEVAASQREIGKTVNFATVYGQGPAALAEQLGIPHQQARRYIERFFATYAGVRRWRDHNLVEAYHQGFVTTLAGRRRYLPELTITTRSDQAYGERLAMNTPVQGSAADLCKLAMRRIGEALQDHRSGLVLQIHDELVLEVAEEELDAVKTIVVRAMTHDLGLEVPLVASVGVGSTWADAHPD